MDNKTKGAWSGLAAFAALVALGVSIYIAVNRIGNVPRGPGPSGPGEGGPSPTDWARQLADADPAVRRAAADSVQVEVSSLAGLRQVDPECLPVLLRTLHSPEEKVRTASARLLGGIGPDVVPALLDDLRRTERQRYSLPVGLLALQPLAQARLLVLEPRLRGRYLDAVMRVSMALASISYRRGGPPLAPLREGLSDSVPAVRTGCAGALLFAAKTSSGEERVAEAVPDLARLLRDPDVDARVMAGLALAAAGEPGVKALGEALTAPDPLVRIAAASGLAQMGPTVAEAAIPPRAGTRDRSFEAYLRKKRCERKEPIRPILRRALADKTPEVRLYAAVALADFAAERAALAPVLNADYRSSPNFQK